MDDAHISELHALAAELGVPGYRLMRRSELLDAVREAGGERDVDSVARSEQKEKRRGDELPNERRPSEDRRGGGRGTCERQGARRGRERERAHEAEEEVDALDAEPVSGVLDILPQRYGFLRLKGLESADGDVYISASQIRRCELRPGDEVSGPAREPRRGERHRALVHVDKVNGEDPSEDGRGEFDELTPVPPTRRLPLESVDGDEGVLVRAADLLAPLAYGQRVLVATTPGGGRTTLLRGLASALDSAEGPELIVLLIDERPEEATRWRRAFPESRLAIATAEMSGAEQGQVADLALARAKRIAESGADAVLIADSLSRLVAARGRLDAAKALFGAGREIEEESAGSLTVIATVFEDDEVADAIATTESALIALDPELAAEGVVPAIDAARSRVSGEEDLRQGDELDAGRRLRSELADLDPRDAATKLRELIDGSKTNAELLEKL
ncbi:MAG: Rho termination factor N-terminal domain-containing protein [Solirubrobacterales bacterium]